MSRVSETRFLFQHELCECKCGLHGSVFLWEFNLKQKCNHDECWCGCKELDACCFLKMIICGILIPETVSVKRHIKLTNTFMSS